MIVNSVHRSLQPPLHGAHLGLIAPQINRLELGQETGTGKAILGGVLVTAIGMAAIGTGAYIGGKHGGAKKPGWAAAGAIIGELAFTGLALLVGAIAARKEIPQP